MPDTAEAVDLQAGRPAEHVDGPKQRAKRAKESRQKASLPKPKSLRVSVDQFEKWGRSFSVDQKGRAIFHVYRDWPVINRKLIGEHKEKLIDLWNGEFPTELPLREFILHEPNWGGSGKYKIMCTEIGVPGCISMTSFELEDGDFPPKVDPATLIVGHPLNKGYLEGLRASGVTIPGDDPDKFRAQQQEQKQMDIATAAFENMARQNEKLNEKIDELSERLEETEEPEPEDDIQPVSQTVLETGLRMIEKQVDRVGAQAAVSYNPIEVAKSVMDMAKEMKGDSTGVVAIMQTMMDNQTRILTQMADQAKKDADYWRDRALSQSTAVVPAEPAKSMMDQVKELAEFKALSRELFGREPRTEREPEPARKSWIETLLENPQLPALANGLFSTLAQLAVAFRNGTPTSPESLRGVLNGTANGTAPQVAQPQAQPQTDPQEQARQATRAFLQRIEKPFIAHFFDTEQQDLNGYTFAHRMHCEFVPDGPVTNTGRAEYITIRDRWGQQFDQLLRSYDPIWQMVQGNVPKYQQFLKEFFSYDQYINENNGSTPTVELKAN